MNIMLQILEEGMITDSNGVKIDFRNTVIILTSNVGASTAKGQGVLASQTLMQKSNTIDS